MRLLILILLAAPLLAQNKTGGALSQPVTNIMNRPITTGVPFMGQADGNDDETGDSGGDGGGWAGRGTGRAAHAAAAHAAQTAHHARRLSLLAASDQGGVRSRRHDTARSGL